MKLIPGSTDRIMANLEDTKSFFKSNFANKLTPAFQLYKIELAQAVICYKQKQVIFCINIIFLNLVTLLSICLFCSIKQDFSILELYLISIRNK